MNYIIAYDGGGTKTHIGVFDFFGNLHYEKIGCGSNHHSGGSNHFVETIRTLFMEALETLRIDKQAIAHVYLGLSGADRPSDFERLNRYCAEIFNPITFTVANDAWIVMRSGLKAPFGAVAIAGTGTNSAAINPQGKRAILRSLGYTLGIYGGGLDIARDALHYAFRADELTYKETMLKQVILDYFDCVDMETLVDYFYPTIQVDRIMFGGITALVNDCAEAGDDVAQQILRRAGRYIGRQTIGVMKQVDITSMAVPVVIGGKVFSGKSPLLIETMMKEIIKECPEAYLVIPNDPPVVGAYLSALDVLGINQDETIEQNLKKRGDLDA